MPNQTPPKDSYNPKIAPLLVALSPLMFVLCYTLAAVQGADWKLCLLISGIGTLGCLGAAGLYRLRGSKAEGDAWWLVAILRFFGGR